MGLCQLNNNQGFTLLEVIFALTVLTIIISLSAPIIFSTLDKQTEKQFFELLFSDLLLIQTASHGKNNVRAYIDFDDFFYSVHISDDKNNKMTRPYPIGWKKDHRPYRRISFKNGTIREPGTILIHSDNADYRIIFPLGKGRGYIDKQ